ncbi:MAG: N-acetyl sugar amidotransferase [Bdellovibrionaceae bacterium]|nr:N-acetyl sugar amidotransferase [Pseudobdellovibrionaceae bacterium]
MVEASNLKVCHRCVMDSTDPDIIFLADGTCSHCEDFEKRWSALKLKKLNLEELFQSIRNSGRGKEYDCVLGLSGGVDSSYVAYLAHQAGLRPLCVHLDNGWNSELAVANINSLVKKCGFDLYTHVLDWDEFRDLQRSFFFAHVVDLELLTDHAIFGIILRLARKHKIRHILSGANLATEAVMPRSWVHRKQDAKNIVAIHKRFGTLPLRTFPLVSTAEHVFTMYGLGFQVHKPLNCIDYNKHKAKAILQSEFGWRDYGGKHYESLFTKFYQAHILPTKFGIDKRKAHLSSLILSGQLSREEALRELASPLYPPQELAADTDYVCKKLGFNQDWLSYYLSAPRVEHESYGSDKFIYEFLRFGKSLASKIGLQTA